MTYFRFNFISFFIVCIGVVSAQGSLSTRLKFNTLTIEDGLSNNFINDVVQDSLGFIWIGTNDGLSRYDGNKFINFSESLSGENSISNNYIQSLFLDSKGQLWILTDDGLNFFNARKNRFETIPSYSEGGLSHHSISAFEEGEEDTFYVGTYGGGLDVLKGGKVIRNFNEVNSDLSSNLISSIQFKSQNEIWVCTWYNGLLKFNLETEKFERIQFKGALENLTIYDSFLDDEGYLFLATNEGIVYLNTNSGNQVFVSEQENDSMSDSDILSIFEDDQNSLWIGTRNNGIMRISKEEFIRNPYQVTFERFTPSDSDQSVNYRSVSCFFQDVQRNIWIGTHNSGLNIVNPVGERIIGINRLPGFTREDENTSVWGIIEDRNDNLWLGTDGEGLLKLNLVSGETIRFVQNDQDSNSLSDNAVLSACEDNEGNLWFGTYSGGLNKINSENNKVRVYKQGALSNELNRNDIRALFTDAQGRVWIGTNGGGLQLYRPQTDDFLFIDALGWIDIRSITEDSKGNLWLGTFGSGMLSYNHESGEVRTIDILDDYEATIIFSVAFSTPNDLWIGTRYKGLLHMNIETNTIQQYSTEEGLSNNTIHSIVPISEKEIWLSTNNGINVLDSEKKKVKSFQRAHGVISGPFNNNSGFLSTNGFVVFGGTTGVNLFYPEKLKGESRKLKIVLTDFKLSNASVKVDDKTNKILQESIFFQDELKLKYNHDVISVDYAALNFPNSSDIKYAYYLENYDDTWNEVGNETSATYRNLAPGDYVFKVKISDEEGFLSSDVKTLNISVSPHFLLTWPAILIYIVLIALAIFGVAKYYSHQVKLQNTLYFEQKLRQQEKDLNKERFRFFTNFSHELRTPLTLIFGPVTDLLRQERNSERKSKLQIVHRNSEILLELINKMLEFRKTETEHNHLEVGNYEIREFLNKIAGNFRFYAEQKSIDFQIQESKRIYGWFDYKKIQNVIINLLSNAFKYTEAGGKVFIGLEELEDRVYIHFRDTGRGIHPESIEAVFDLYYHKDYMETIEGTGIGLALCKKLMDLHEAEIKVESELGLGSCFTIELFKNKSHFEGMENVEFLNSSKFIIKKPFINDPELLNTSEKNGEIDKDDRIILVVDDNPDIRSYISEILGDSYKIVIAENGKEGIEKAKELIPDMVISDVMMPVKSGVDLCIELKSSELTSHIPIILLTAKLGEKDKLQGMKIGADDYITKPFYSEYLVTRIDNIFKNRAKLVEHFNLTNSANEVVEKEKTKDDIFLENLAAKILEDANKPNFSVNDLAEELGFSRSSLYRKVKALTGLSINHIIRKVLMKRAGELLLTGNYNVSEVAYELGFNDVTKFRKYFKEEFGVVPSKFKDKMEE